MVNTSPEPVSNIVASTTEDVLSAGGLWLVLAHPATAIVIAIMLLAAVLALVALSWHLLGRMRRWFSRSGR